VGAEVRAGGRWGERGKCARATTEGPREGGARRGRSPSGEGLGGFVTPKRHVPGTARRPEGPLGDLCSHCSKSDSSNDQKDYAGEDPTMAGSAS